MTIKETESNPDESRTTGKVEKQALNQGKSDDHSLETLALVLSLTNDETLKAASDKVSLISAISKSAQGKTVEEKWKPAITYTATLGAQQVLATFAASTLQGATGIALTLALGEIISYLVEAGPQGLILDVDRFLSNTTRMGLDYVEEALKAEEISNKDVEDRIYREREYMRIPPEQMENWGKLKRIVKAKMTKGEIIKYEDMTTPVINSANTNLSESLKKSNRKIYQQYADHIKTYPDEGFIIYLRSKHPSIYQSLVEAGSIIEDYSHYKYDKDRGWINVEGRRSSLFKFQSPPLSLMRVYEESLNEYSQHFGDKELGLSFNPALLNPILNESVMPHNYSESTQPSEQKDDSYYPQYPQDWFGQELPFERPDIMQNYINELIRAQESDLARHLATEAATPISGR